MFRGCCLGVAALVALTVVAAVLLFRLTSSPDLGADPSGPSHGDSPGTIATTLAGQLAKDLATMPHAKITLSEQDLTVIAAAENPDPLKFRDPHVRARAGQLQVDAHNNLGPFQVVTTARVQVSLLPGGHLTAHVVQVDVGSQTVPEWMRSFVDSRGSATLSIDPFLNNPGLQPLRDLLECGVVVDSGFRLGFHRPGGSADATTCS
jgi:hypothetical protein